MQLCTKEKGFILDLIKLEGDPKFDNFMADFLTNSRLLKVGHTVDSDMKELAHDFKLPNNKRCEGFIDIGKIFKTKHPGTKYSSLSYMC